jgi:UDP-N-acetylglucosamine 1-carboxyvinyltransferase
MGAEIRGIGSNRLIVRWPHAPVPPREAIRLDDDFMEAATYAVAAAITKSDLDITHAQVQDLELVDRYLRWMGVRTQVLPEQNLWRIKGSKSSLEIDARRLKAIKAEPWPRFPTDVMSAFVVLATRCTGTLKFLEYMYDDRFGFIPLLEDMGASIRREGQHVITVSGPTALSGNEAFLRPDIRSGAAMLLAALAADGKSILHDRRSVIARGYQDLPKTLASLGARIAEVSEPFGI